MMVSVVKTALLSLWSAAAFAAAAASSKGEDDEKQGGWAYSACLA
jgi:hypothetical protein